MVGVVMRGGGTAARLALQDVQAAGGAQLRLWVFTGSETTSGREAVAVAESLAADPRVVAVVGHTNSPASLAASQFYNEHRLPQISPTATADLYSAAGPYSFRLVPGDRRQAAFLAIHVARLRPRAQVAVVYVNDDYSRGLRAGLVRSLAELRVRLVYEAPFLEGGGENRELSDFASLAEGVGYAGADVVLWLGRWPELEVCLPLLRQVSPEILVFASDGVESDPVFHEAGGRFTGLRFVRFVDTHAEDETLGALRRRYRMLSGRELTSQSLLAYEAIRLVAEAVRAGAQSREAVRTYLNSLGRTRPPYQGVSGAIAFDRNGDNVRPYELAVVTPQGFHPLAASQ